MQTTNNNAVANNNNNNVVAARATIRDAVLSKFAQMLATRSVTGNTVFRRTVMDYAMLEHGCTNAAAATHYNFCLQAYKADEALCVHVEGLGRSDDKKGGRRTKDGKATATVYAKLFANIIAEEQEVAVVQEVAVQLYNVRSIKKGLIVAEGLTEAQAEEFIAANNAKQFVAKCEMYAA